MSLGESELCYWDIDCHKSFSVYFSEGIKNSHDMWFSKDCAGSDHLFGCAGLRKRVIIFLTSAIYEGRMGTQSKRI